MELRSEGEGGGTTAPPQDARPARRRGSREVRRQRGASPAPSAAETAVSLIEGERAIIGLAAYLAGARQSFSRLDANKFHFLGKNV